MAQQTAAYEGLQYSSQYKPVDYGQIAVGVTNLIEKKKAEEKARLDKLEKQQMQLIKDYGDEVYSSFDMTGLENADQLAFQVKERIIDRADSITKMLNNGEITGPEASKMMLSLKSQSGKVSEYVGGLKKYAEELQAKGENMSPADELNLARINDMYSKGVSVGMDANGNLMFISEEDGKMVPSPFSKLSKYTTFSDNPTPISVVDTVMKNAKSIQSIDKKNNVVKVSLLNKNGDLTENQKNAYGEYVKDLEGSQLYNMAINSGLDKKEIDYTLDGELKINNEEDVRNKILEHLYEETKAKYGGVQVDEVAGEKLRMERERISISRSNAAASKTKDTPSQPFETDEYTIYPQKNLPGQKPIPSITLGGVAYPNAVVQSYSKSKTGGPDIVGITYTIPGETNFDNPTTETVNIPVTNPQEIAVLSGMFNIPGSIINTTAGGAGQWNKPTNNKS